MTSKEIVLTAQPRAGSGKGEARKLRREGRVPAIAYGADLDKSMPVSVDALDLYRALNTDAGVNAIITLELDGTRQLVMARELQRHPVNRHLVHADFVTVSRTVKVQVDVPIELQGTAAGEEDGGVAEQALFSLPVEVLPLEVPDQLTLDISEMQVGDVLRVSDLDLPAGVESLEDADQTVVTVNIPDLEVPEPEPEEAEEAEEGEEGLERAEEAAEEGAESPEESSDAASSPEHHGS